MYFVDNKVKVRLKMSLSQYQDVCNILNRIEPGLTLEYIEENLCNYKKLIDLLKKIGIVYEIPKKLYENIKDNAYFPIVESISENIVEDLYNINEVCVYINNDFLGSNEIEKVLQSSEIKYVILKNMENHIEIVFSHGGKKYINAFKNNIGEIMIVKRSVKDFKYLFSDVLTKDIISPKVLSIFCFSCIIESIVSNDTMGNFIINENLEVKRKKDYIPNQQIQSKEKVEQQKNTNNKTEFLLNSLELFVSNTTSKVISFNNNLDYGKYEQAPLQVFTIQYYDFKNNFKSCYFSDISYKRLCDFIGEVAFINILKRSYGKEYRILKKQESINDTLVTNSNSDIKKISIETLGDCEAILDLMKERKLDLDLYQKKLDDDKYYIYLLDKNQNNTYRFNMPIKDKDYISVVIYTYISALQNSVDLSKASFEKVNLNHNIEECFGKHSNIVDEHSKDTFLIWKVSSINSLLEDYGFKYNVQEI